MEKEENVREHLIRLIDLKKSNLNSMVKKKKNRAKK